VGGLEFNPSPHNVWILSPYYSLYSVLKSIGRIGL